MIDEILIKIIEAILVILGCAILFTIVMAAINFVACLNG